MVPTDLFGLLDHLDLEMLEQVDDEITARCPAHQYRTGRIDYNPSWSINEETGLHHCWSCEFGGSLTQLVMHVRDCDLWSARRFIRKHGVDFDQLLDSFAPEEPPEVTHQPLRGLSLWERFERFTRPPVKALQSRGIVNDRIVHAGLEQWAVELYGIRWNPDRRSWIIPWHDQTGDFVGWQEKGDGWYRHFPKGVSRGDSLFGLGNLAGLESEVLLVESPLDVVYLAQHQYDGLALAGSSLSDKAERLLLERADGEIVVALDNDTAGRHLSKELKFRLGRRHNTSFFNYRGLKGKDIGELTKDQIDRGMRHRIDSLRY